MGKSEKGLRFTVDRKEFLKCLHDVDGPQQGELANSRDWVLLELKANELTVTTVGLTLSIQKKLEVHSQGKGALWTQYRFLRNYMDEMDSERVSFKANKLVLEVTPEEKKLPLTRLRCLEADAIELRIKNMPPFCKISESVLKDMIPRVSYAMASKEDIPVFNGLHIKFNSDSLTATATDRRRMSRLEQRVESLAFQRNHISRTITIPRQVLSHLKNFKPGELVQLTTEKTDSTDKEAPSFLSLVGEQLTVFTSLLYGVAPDYDDVIPTKFIGSITIKRADLEVALKRMNAPRGSEPVKLKIQGEILKLERVSVAFGEIQDEIPVLENRGGEAIQERLYNLGYLLDIVLNIKSEKLQFKTTGKAESEPMLICDPDEPGFLAAVMAVKNGTNDNTPANTEGGEVGAVAGGRV